MQKDENAKKLEEFIELHDHLKYESFPDYVEKVWDFISAQQKQYCVPNSSLWCQFYNVLTEVMFLLVSAPYSTFLQEKTHADLSRCTRWFFSSDASVNSYHQAQEIAVNINVCPTLNPRRARTRAHGGT